MSGYIGNIPTPQATQSRQSFTATAGQTTFATSGYTAGFLDVYLNGVHLLDGTDYTATNGSDIVLTVGAALDDVVEFVAYETFSVLDPTFTGTTTTEDLTTTGAFTSLGIDDNAAATAITIDGSQNVGIGTAPSVPLHIETLSNSGTGTPTEVLRLQVTEAPESSNLVSGDGTKMSFYVPEGNQTTQEGAAISAVRESGTDTNASTALTFSTAADDAAISEAMRINSSGHAIIPAGVTLGTAAGVYNAANTLDDYEEGTWTPAFSSTFVEGAFNSATGFSGASGRYVRIGEFVQCWAEIADITGASGNLVGDDNFSFTEASLPFTPTNTTSFHHLQGTVNLYNAVGSGSNASGTLIHLSGQTVIVAQFTARSNTVSSTGAGAFGLGFSYRTTS